LKAPANADSVALQCASTAEAGAMMFYEFRLEDRIPKCHLLRRRNVFVTVALADLHRTLEPFYSEIVVPRLTRS
jgi:hypothetical protein